jgi:hypothetical protein
MLTTGGQAGAARPTGPQVYEVTGTGTAQHRTEVARTGADILDAEGTTATVIANPAEAAQLRALGFDVRALGAVDRPQSTATVEDFPAGYIGYHTCADTAPGLTAAEAQKFQTLGGQMAATNGYTPQ